MRRSKPIAQAVVGSLVLLACVVGLAVVLQTLVVDAPTLRDGTFADGLRHGTQAPAGGWRWLMGTGAVKDFGSGWGYEVGFHLGALALVVAWQTVLQARTFAVAGRRSPLIRPFLLGTLGGWGALLLLGLFLGDPVVPLGEVPSLFGLVPGWLRHGAMAVFGLLMVVSGLVAGGDLLRRGV